MRAHPVTTYRQHRRRRWVICLTTTSRFEAIDVGNAAQRRLRDTGLPEYSQNEVRLSIHIPIHIRWKLLREPPLQYAVGHRSVGIVSKVIPYRQMIRQGGTPADAQI